MGMLLSPLAGEVEETVGGFAPLVELSTTVLLSALVPLSALLELPPPLQPNIKNIIYNEISILILIIFSLFVCMI
jgi:hypothetical protein